MSYPRLLVRAHGLWIAVWALLLGAMTAWGLPAYADTLATPEARAAAVDRARGQVATQLLYGELPPPGTPAQMFTWEMGTAVVVLAAVCGVLLTVRVTRAAEADGMLELVRTSGVSPRRVAITQWAVIVAAALACASAVGAALALVRREDGVDLAGSVAFAAVVALTFLLLAGLTGVATEVFASPAAARSAGFAALGVAFAMRAVGDVQGWSWLADVSPLGLRGAVEPFTNDAPLPLLVAAAVAAVLLATALVATLSREYGASLLRPAPRSARRLPVRSPAGLTWCLARGGVLAWALSLAATGALLAGMGDGVIEAARSGDLEGGVLGSALADGDPVASYFAYLGTLVGCVIAVQALLAVSRAARDERSGIDEVVRATGRSRWSSLAVASGLALTGTLATALAAAGAAALVAPQVVEGADGSVAWSAFRSLIGQWPGLVALTGIAALVVGIAPRRAWVMWIPYAVSALLALYGALLSIPQWAIDASVFGHAPDAGLASVGQGLLLVVGVAALALAMLAVNRRDLTPG